VSLRRGGYTAWLVLWLATATDAAFAHAPLARDLAIAPEGAPLALRMPGFGLLISEGGAHPSFAYACDALLDLQAHESNAPFVYPQDGTLLVGTERGLRSLGKDGCPLATQGGELAQTSIAWLVAHETDANLLYAVSGDAPAALYRSGDGGVQWELRTRFADARAVTALVLDATDREVIYVSRGGDGQHGAVERSLDGGATFAAFDQERELMLLHVNSNARSRLWAMVRTGAVRGVDILRAEEPAGPWQVALHLNFFGGFAVDAESGAIWVGDEGGGVFRSVDHGDSFENVAPKTAVACLALARGELWACTPGSSRQAALQRWREPTGFEAVAAFAEVDRLIECAPAAEVPTRCAVAWTEWRADVLSQAQMSASDGTPPEASDAGGAANAGGVHARAPAACSSANAGTRHAAIAPCLLVAGVARRRRALSRAARRV
jgi:hypothetical protein